MCVKTIIYNEKKKRIMMAEPFEKIFGDTSELRVIESLLPNKNRDFNITEIAEESDISRQAAIPVVKKFLKWNLLKIDSKRGNANYYKVNEDSDFIKAFREINNNIITRILGEVEMQSRPVQPASLGIDSQSYIAGTGSDRQENCWIRLGTVEP
jgi:DNA-binding transcriptional regulator GbsR (MarR family)